jgi:geranylgeranyl diphosphate synthase type I
LSSIETVTTPESLIRARELTVPALRRALYRLPAASRTIAEFHLGWVDLQGRPDGRGGKMVRPALAVLSAEAAGMEAEVGVPGGVAVEFIHNFSLLHDDIMDGDRERRHRPTVWAAFGVPDAIITGDALMALGLQILLERDDLPPDRILRAAHKLCSSTAEMIVGQIEDGVFERRQRVSWEECVAMEAKKTGALLSCASSIGAILAGASEETVACLAGFGLHLGLAFQAVDDLLGIWGSPEVTGKPASSDLRQGKKSLPVTAALEAACAEAQELQGLLHAARVKGGLAEDSVGRAAQLVEACGGRARTEGFAAGELERAEALLDSASLAPAAAQELRALGRFLGARDR